MNKIRAFFKTKEYKRFTKFCEALLKYIGVFYGILGVGRTVSARHYANWDSIYKQIDFKVNKEIRIDATKEILFPNTIF
ncbi:MAG: hypothetical protein ACLRPU_16515 [Enterococcus hulanensis]